MLQHSRTQYYLDNFNRMLQSTRHRSLTDFRLPASEALRILLENCWLCLLMTRCVFCGVPCGTHYSSIVNLQISCCTHLYIFIAPKQLVKSHLLSLERYIFQGAVFLLGIQFSSKKLAVCTFIQFARCLVNRKSGLSPDVSLLMRQVLLK